MNELSKKIEVMREMAFESLDIGADIILTEFYNFLDENEMAIKECYKVDNNVESSKVDLTIKRMLDTIESVKSCESIDTKIFTLINERKFVQYRQNKGVLGVIYDGNIYITVDLIAKSIKSGNALILNIGLNNNIGTNNLIVKGIKEILYRNNKPSQLIEINFSENDSLSKESLDSLIVVGNRECQNKHRISNNDTINSGYGYCEIYIDDLNNVNIIKEIIKNSEYKLDIYIKNSLQTDIQGLRVDGLMNALNYINKYGAGFATSIFSDNPTSQKIFLKRSKSKYVFVNADPNIAEDSNINIQNFYNNKIGMV